MATATTDNHALDNALAHLKTIHASWLACEWLRSNCRDGNDLNTEARHILRDHGWPTDDADDVADAIEAELRELPLSLQFRSAWQPCGSELEPAEFELLLSTGGPACRIIGEVSDYTGGLINPTLQWQDWFTLWGDTDTTSDQDEALEWFVGLFSA